MSVRVIELAVDMEHGTDKQPTTLCTRAGGRLCRVVCPSCPAFYTCLIHVRISRVSYFFKIIFLLQGSRRNIRIFFVGACSTFLSLIIQ